VVPGRGLRRRTLLVAPLLAAATAVCTGASQGLGPATADPWSVSTNPFALSFTAASAVTQPTGPPGPGTRMSYQLGDGSFHTLTGLQRAQATADGAVYTVATDEPGRAASVAVSRIPHGFHVGLTLHPADGVTAVFSALRSSAGDEHFVGTGIQHGTVDLRGELVQLKVAYACGRSIVVPFYASSAGYGVYYETDAPGQMEFRGSHDGMPCGTPNERHPLCRVASAPDRVQACFEGSSLAYDVFLGRPTDTIRAFRLAAGRPAAPPLQTFAAVKWRDRIRSSADVRDDVQRFHSLHIPLGAVLVDNPWERQGCVGSLSFDPKVVGNAAALVHDVHAAGVRFDLWVSPRVSTNAGCPRPAGYTASSLIQPPTDETYDLVDLTRASARAAFEAKIAALVRLGVDGFKGDRGDEADLEGLAFAQASPATHNDYPALFARAVQSGARRVGAREPFLMMRAGSRATPSIGAAVWAGDQTPDWAGLQDAIRSLASLGASGFGIAGSDVGGYSTQSGARVLTAAVLGRWAQLGAISPIFEIGGADRAATFWTLGPHAIASVRDSVLLHYALVPYFTRLARSWATTGAPLLQPLGAVWPGDRRAWSHDLELLLGDDVLAAPVTSITARPAVYVPRGLWVDLFAGRRVPGGRVVRRPTPPAQFPLYLRAGVTIPFDFRTPDVWTAPWPLDAVRVVGRTGFLAAGRTARITGGERETAVILAGAEGARRVTVDGRPLRRVPSQRLLGRAREGWTSVSAPFPGVVVKLRAPHDGTAEVRAS
jgi:alpha-D-xyloside xylohydrolase